MPIGGRRSKMTNLKKILLGTAFALTTAGCYSNPEIEKVGDMTGDGISDIMIKNMEGRYIFIGQKDSTYIRATETQMLETEISSFKTDDGRVYFFDGQFYKEAIKNDKKILEKQN